MARRGFPGLSGLIRYRGLLQMILVVGIGGRPSVAVAQERDEYVVRFAEARPLRASVHAELHLAEGVIRASGYGAWSQPDGWASFIENLEVRGLNGRRLATEKIDRLTWRVDGQRGDRIVVDYEVDLSHAAEPDWPDGPRSTGVITIDGAMSAIGGALFLVADSTRAKLVEFELPASWSVAAPWRRVNADPRRFEVGTGRDLTGNVFVVGRFEEARIEAGGLEVGLVMLGEHETAAPLVADALREIAASYTRLFGLQGSHRYLMVWFADGEWETGEGYHDSYVVVTPHTPTPRDRVVWAKSIAHELLHYWVGHRLEAADWAATQWFSEGFTEFVAWLTLIRTGLVDERESLDLAQKYTILYQNFRYRWGTPYERLSLVDAGQDKSHYNVAIYDGGWVTALCIDGMIREASPETDGVLTLLRRLYEEFGQAERPYTLDEVVAAAAELGTDSVRSFYRDYVAGTGMIPLEACFRRAGFDAVTTVYSTHVRMDPDAAETALRVRRSMLRH